CDIKIAGNGDHEIAGKFPDTTTLPVSDDPGGIALRVGADLIRLKFAAGLLLRRGISTTMNGVSDSRLRTAFDPYRSHVYFYSQSLGCGQIASDLLDPVAALAIDTGFLAHGQGRQRRQQESDAG